MSASSRKRGRDDADFVDAKVVVHGLENRTDLNGCVGTGLWALPSDAHDVALWALKVRVCEFKRDARVKLLSGMHREVLAFAPALGRSWVSTWWV